MVHGMIGRNKLVIVLGRTDINLSKALMWQRTRTGRSRVLAGNVKFVKQLIKFSLVCPDASDWDDRKKTCVCHDK